MKRSILLFAVVQPACADIRSSPDLAMHDDGSDDTEAPDDAESGHATTSTSPDEDGSSTGDPDGSTKLDVGSAETGPAPGESCAKVDFLFVIDNSGSMAEEQAQLVQSFPAFVSAIEQSVADDLHIMVIDSDESFAIDQCDEICPSNPEDTCVACASADECVNLPCADFPPALTCDDILGAGRLTSPAGNDCGLAGPQRFLTGAQLDRSDAFACIATVGTGASGERPMQSMVDAVGLLADAGECNAGFLRDDAILVVTVISDEDDTEDDDGIVSVGTIEQWHDAVVDAKGGNEDAVVFLGLISDIGIDGAVCQETDPPEAGPAPRLRALAESFSRGQWGSVCSDDYGPFFADAISPIDVACDEFEPAG